MRVKAIVLVPLFGGLIAILFLEHKLAYNRAGNVKNRESLNVTRGNDSSIQYDSE